MDFYELVENFKVPRLHIIQKDIQTIALSIILARQDNLPLSLYPFYYILRNTNSPEYKPAVYKLDPREIYILVDKKQIHQAALPQEKMQLKIYKIHKISAKPRN